MRLWVGMLGLCLWCVACGDDGGGGGGGGQPDAGQLDADVTDTGLPEVDAAVDGASDAAMDAPPMLPACNLVCDRVLDCASMDCAGIDWRTARLAQDLCDDACGSALNAPVMAAADCDAVMNVVASAAPRLDALCNEPPCVTACAEFARCTKASCPRYADQTEEAIAAGCMGWCEDDNAGDILNVTCDVLIDSLVTNDPNFAASCQGTMGCAERPACETYAAKTTACILDHCSGNADDFEASIEAVLIDYCTIGEDCPAPEAIAYVNGDAVTCDDPPLDAVGPAAPFTSICAGTVGATAAELLVACDTLIGCGAMFTSGELCAAFLTFEAGASTKAMCIDAAADCTEAFACL